MSWKVRVLQVGLQRPPAKVVGFPAKRTLQADPTMGFVEAALPTSDTDLWRQALSNTGSFPADIWYTATDCLTIAEHTQLTTRTSKDG